MRTFYSETEETAVLLVLGAVEFGWNGNCRKGTRDSFIDQGPYCLHVSRGVTVTVRAEADSEVLVQSTENDGDFPPVFYRPEDCRDDIFGKDVFDNKMKRTVRTVFDYSNAPYSNMVNGEVINRIDFSTTREYVTDIMKYSAELIDKTEINLKYADVNGDGIVNVTDATAVQKALAGIK